MARPPRSKADISVDTDTVTDDPRQAPRSLDILLTEVAKLDSDVQYLKRDLSEVRTDMRDVRDRMARLEERVAHLPSKEFIVGVVVTSLVIAGGIATLAPRFWSLAGTPVTIATPHPAPGVPQK